MTHRDPRLWCLLLAAVCALAGLFDPQLRYSQQRLDALFVVDITGSMMVRDYGSERDPVSRLDRVKTALARTLSTMPCGSRAGLAIFSERQPFLLVSPAETCDNYAPLAGTVEHLDWRMAWEGDSFIALGLHRAIEMAGRLDTDLVFITDGHEAPPLPPYSEPPAFRGERGEVRGLIVGVGGDELSPIPKFDAEGREAGFLGHDEVVQENRSGLPPPQVHQREGYEPRNAPWGSAPATGDEHLSSLREPYLKLLAEDAGLGYARLGEGGDLVRPLARHSTPRKGIARAALSPWLAGLALLSLLSVWTAVPWLERRRAVQVDSNRLDCLSPSHPRRHA